MAARGARARAHDPPPPNAPAVTPAWRAELIAVMQGVFHAYPVSFDLSCHGLNEFHGLRGANTSTRPEHVFGGGSMWPMPRMAEVHPACARVLHLARAAGKKSSLRRRRRSSASSLAPSTRRSH